LFHADQRYGGDEEAEDVVQRGQAPTQILPVDHRRVPGARFDDDVFDCEVSVSYRVLSLGLCARPSHHVMHHGLRLDGGWNCPPYIVDRNDGTLFAQHVADLDRNADAAAELGLQAAEALAPRLPRDESMQLIAMSRRL